MDDGSALQYTCRACSAQKQNDVYTPLFAGPTSCQELHRNALAELIAFNLKIGLDDGLPQQICSRCLDNFTFIVQFREQCKDAQEVLEAIYERNDKNNSDIKLLDDCDFKYESSIKTEEENSGSNKIEEVNIDDQNYYEEDHWVCEYLNDGKPTSPEDAQTENSPDATNNSQNENVSDSESDNIPLTEFIKGNRPKKSRRKATKKKKLLGREQGECATEVSCKYCGKVCKSSRAFLMHKEKCEAYHEVSCRICTVEFENKDQLEAHVQQLHPNGGDPMCPICSQTFTESSKRDIHMRQTHGDGQYKCGLCDREFKSKMYLKSHINRHHHSGDTECSICHEKFPNISKFRYHWTHAHIENMKFKCKYCEKPFASQFVMRVHERSHTGERPFLCNECGTAFRYRTQFLDHMKTHDNQRNIACDMCGLTFYTNRQLSNHKRKHMSKNHACEICGEAFAYKLDLYTHRYNEHRVAEFIPKRKVDYPFKCPKCTKGFSVLASLSKHIKIHTDSERKHVCPHCGNGYKRSDHLKLHIKRMHLKIFEHKCEVCGREYLEKCALNAHMVVHNSARPFTCTQCPASFKRQRSLRDHMLKHEGRKEYACGICDMRFFNRTIVVLHTQRVHSDSQKQFMSELVRKELEEATLKVGEEDESVRELKEELINV